METDEILMLRVIDNDDRAAMSELIRRHQVWMPRYLGTATDAPEYWAVKVWARVWECRNTFRGPRNFESSLVNFTLNFVGTLRHATLIAGA
ncbi:MAG TPA: hypothetical protein VGM05_33065 [Planctomycetaceae bacterium]|jgi:DNA-directed RNA polymerase specialized sigma24 family protein